MLAQNFKTAKELRISGKELESLVAVLGMLERGELVDFLDRFRTPAIPNGFSMSTVMEKAGCNIVGCIKGWAIHTAKDDKLFGAMTDSISDLFMCGDNRRHRVTMDQAATALRNYLTTGKANWEEVLG